VGVSKLKGKDGESECELRKNGQKVKSKTRFPDKSEVRPRPQSKIMLQKSYRFFVFFFQEIQELLLLFSLRKKGIDLKYFLLFILDFFKQIFFFTFRVFSVFCVLRAIQDRENFFTNF
jgi:hypothetical protein